MSTTMSRERIRPAGPDGAVTSRVATPAIALLVAILIAITIAAACYLAVPPAAGAHTASPRPPLAAPIGARA